MKLIEIKCPNCGAGIEVEKKGKCKCKYCNTIFMVEDNEDEVIVNTVINNYSGTKPNNNLSEYYVKIVAVIVLAATVFLFFSNYIMFSPYKDKSGFNIVNVEYKSKPESEVLIKLCEYIFKKNIDNIDSSDYEKVKSIKMRRPERKDIRMEFTLEDGTEGRYNLNENDINEEEVYLSDFQCFENINTIELDSTINLSRSYNDVYDLKNLKKLEVFKGASYILASDIDNLFSDNGNIKSLAVGLHSDDDLNVLAEKFKNLEELELYYISEDVSDLTNTSKFEKLKKLSTSLWKDNDYLATLKNLESLRLKGSDKYEDYSVLYAMPNLKELYIEGAEGLKNIDFISNMPNLERLSLERSNVIDIGILQNNKSLKALSLVSNYEIDNYGFIDTIENLEDLYLYTWMANSSDATFDLSKLNKLEKLGIAGRWGFLANGNPTIKELELLIDLADEFDFSVISNLPSLEKLVINGEGYPANIGALSNNNKLREVYAYEAKMYNTDISPLLNMPSLELLQIEGTEAMGLNVENVKENNTLKYIYMDGIESVCRIENGSYNWNQRVLLGDVSDVFSSFTALEDLTIKGAKLKNLNFASRMKQLKRLDVKDNYISDISPIVDLENLEIIWCQKNSIANLDLLKPEITVIR